ncbi:MAG TPA: 16S rRNA (guanine(527)-N(7))-methyltransferase RsmG [Anaerolineales bacterium]|nr:16S rRNA (guanine(527)-N(7))-methyltransferase RsmG [Anaerolineales bacterium]
MDFLASGARSLLNLELSRAQLAAFQIYADELQAWNAKFNLTAIKDSEGIQIKHFLDSLSLLKALCPAAAGEEDGRLRAADPGLRARLVDVGTGAGFPGLPLKIVCPQLQLTLVEATGKKATFCEAVVEKLNLSGVLVVKARAEEVGRDPSHREQYDWAVARAVAEMPVLAEYLLPLVKRGGRALAQKGEGAPAETQAAEGAVKRLGGELEQMIPVELPGIVETRYLVVFKKIAATPPTYPRRSGVPSKEPLK